MKETYFYRFEKLKPEVKKQFGIRSGGRLDCTKYYDPTERLRGLANKKGMLFCTPSDPQFLGIDPPKDRMADVFLKCGSNNLSSLYYYDYENRHFCFGCPDSRKSIVPPDDLYLFEIASDFSWIELYILPKMRYYFRPIYDLFLDGELNEKQNEIKNQLCTFFSYNKGNTLTE
jgi:hypothetical protein